MDTDINAIDSSYTTDEIIYTDIDLDVIINELNEINNLLSDIDTEISGIETFRLKTVS